MKFFENPGVTAALEQLGHECRDFAERDPASAVLHAENPDLELPDRLSDEEAVKAAVLYIGAQAVDELPPTHAVAVIDLMTTSLREAATETT